MSKLHQCETAIVLKDARISILAGTFQELATLPERLENAFAASKPKSLEEAKAIRTLAEENDLLLLAALKGVRSARQRLRDIAGVGRFSIYGRDGQRQQPGLCNEQATRRI